MDSVNSLALTSQVVAVDGGVMLRKQSNRGNIQHYESSVAEGLDLPLLDALMSVDWLGVRGAVDLACGTGRADAWLRERGVRVIDGVDISGMPTHYHRADGEAVTIRSYVHLFSEQHAAGRAAGFSLEEFRECVIDEEWLWSKPKWRPFLHWPVSFALVWRRA